MDEDTQQAAEHQQQMEECRYRDDFWAQYHDALCARQKRERQEWVELNKRLRDAQL